MECTMIFKQNFVVEDRVITGTIEQDERDFYIVLYENGKELKRKLYNNDTNDIYIMTAEMENFLED